MNTATAINECVSDNPGRAILRGARTPLALLESGIVC